MSPIRARVKDGRWVLNEPTRLPEGTTNDLVIDDGGDALTSEKRKILGHAIEKAVASAQAGKLPPADQLIAELRARR